jgi:hypothetical protein
MGITWCRGAGMDSDQLRRVMRDLGDAVSGRWHRSIVAQEDTSGTRSPAHAD